MATRKPITQVGGKYQQIQTGDVITPSTLGTGTTDNTTVLRGDNTWTTISDLEVYLSSLISATAANSINNGDHAQTWNWQLTSSTKTGLSLIESSPSTSGNEITQRLLDVETSIGSTASPIRIRAQGSDVFAFVADVISGNDEPNLFISPGTRATSSTGTGQLLVLKGGSLTDPGFGGGAVYIIGGTGDTDGGEVRIMGGTCTTGNGNSVHLAGANGSVEGSGGSVFATAGNGVGTNRDGGAIVHTAGNATGSGIGGIISLVAGTSPSGVDGSIKITTNGLERLEILGNGGWEVGGSQGTSGYILTSNGSGTPPTWQVSGTTAGRWVLIATYTPTGVAFQNITDFDPLTYVDYRIVLEDILPVTDGADLALRTSTNAGSSYDDGASDYAWQFYGISVAAASSGGDAADTFISITSGGVDNTANSGVTGELKFINPGATKYCHVIGEVAFNRDGVGRTGASVKGVRLSGTDVDAVQIFFTAGNIDSGVIRIYGLTI